jgi:hypothetical protein
MSFTFCGAEYSEDRLIDIVLTAGKSDAASAVHSDGEVPTDAKDVSGGDSRLHLALPPLVTADGQTREASGALPCPVSSALVVSFIVALILFSQQP